MNWIEWIPTAGVILSWTGLGMWIYFLTTEKKVAEDAFRTLQLKLHEEYRDSSARSMRFHEFIDAVENAIHEYKHGKEKSRAKLP